MSEAESKLKTQYILSYQCPDRLGLLASVSGVIAEKNISIDEVSHIIDPQTQTLFARMLLDMSAMKGTMEELHDLLDALASELNIRYSLRAREYKPRVLLAVSKYDHCLNALLTKWRNGILKIDVVGVISNHEDCRGITEFYGLPYYYLPISKDTKPQQEAQILALMQEHKVDLLVLARYMQILSDDLCRQLDGRAINIHHSFLPGFKGARPYHQAYERGVKVIGATAHYVTADLDEGPIIAQEVKPIDSHMTVDEMVQLGHDIEATALTYAIWLHCEERVVINGRRTVIL